MTTSGLATPTPIFSARTSKIKTPSDKTKPDKIENNPCNLLVTLIGSNHR